MTKRESFIKVFERSLEYWTQSTLLMEAIAQHTINNAPFKQRVESFEKSHRTNKAKEWRIPAKSKVLRLLKLSNLRSPPPSPPPSSDKFKRRKRWKSHHKIQVSDTSYVNKWHGRHDHYSFASSSRYTTFLTSGNQSPPPHIVGQLVAGGVALWSHPTVMKPALPIFLTGKWHYICVDSHRIYSLANSLACWDNATSNYVTMIVKEFKSKIRAHFFSPSSLISITGFLATFKLECGTGRKHEEATECTFSIIVKRVLTSTLNGRM